MNTIFLVGNIGQHPVLRFTGSGTAVANVTLATNRVWRGRDGNRQQSTEWHRLTVWGEGAKNFAEIVSRGDLVSVRGRLEYREREIAGQKVLDAGIRVDEWTKLSPRKPGEQAQADDDGDGPSDESDGATGEEDPGPASSLAISPSTRPSPSPLPRRTARPPRAASARSRAATGREPNAPGRHRRGSGVGGPSEDR